MVEGSDRKAILELTDRYNSNFSIEGQQQIMSEVSRPFSRNADVSQMIDFA